MKASRLKWVISLVVALCVALPAGLAFAQAAGLTAVGAPDPAHGFPKWYIDGNGLQLAPCLDNNAADPCGLVAAGALPNPAGAVVFPGNFPNEVFYNRATARIDGIGGGASRADLGIALEGAFGGATGTVADGRAAEVVFARLRIRVNGGLVPGASYTATYPFGSQTFVASAAGTINFTDNQGCAAAPPACDFTLALANTHVGPFLQWDPAASVPPAGYIGNPAIPHAIIGSATNVFSISGLNVGGAGVNTVSTNLFNVTGKIFVRASTTTTLTSSPNPSTVGQAVTLTATVRPVAPATGVPNGTVAFKDGAATIGSATLGATGSASISVTTLATGSHPLTAVYSGSLDFLTSTSATVTQVVNAVAPPPPAAGADTVTIGRADRAGNQLRVEGTTSRLANGTFAASVEIHDGTIVGGACTGALITTTPVSGGSWAFRGTTTILGTSVCVKSAGGGVASRALQLK